MSEFDYKKLFRDLRKRMQISQATLATLVGANRDMIANYEMGRCRPSADILMRALELKQKKRRAIKDGDNLR